MTGSFRRPRIIGKTPVSFSSLRADVMLSPLVRTRDRLYSKPCRGREGVFWYDGVVVRLPRNRHRDRRGDGNGLRIDAKLSKMTTFCADHGAIIAAFL